MPSGRSFEKPDEYAFSRIAEMAGETDPNRVKSAILGAFERAYLGYAMGEEDVGTNNLLWARRLWQRLMGAIGTEKQKERVALPPLDLLSEQVLKSLLAPDALDPVLAAQLRTRMKLPADYGLSGTGPRCNQVRAAPTRFLLRTLSRAHRRKRIFEGIKKAFSQEKAYILRINY